MFVLNDDLSIYVTRGDVVFFSVSAEDNGEAYTFKAGDVVRIKVFAKKDASTVVLQKDFPVTKDTEAVDILLTKEETKIGNVISKPVVYWYEIELNPHSAPQTIIGYDEDGAKEFRLFPEGNDVPPDEPIKPEDIPVVDDELDLTSTRPVENQAIARAVVQLRAAFEDTKEDITAKTDKAAKDVASAKAEIAVERARIDNLLASAAAPVDGDTSFLELADIRVGADGATYTSAGEATREQIKDVGGKIERVAEFSRNMFDKASVSNGYYVNMLGEENAAEDMFTSDFIPVQHGKTYSFPVLTSVYGVNANKIAAYGSGKEYLTWLVGNEENEILTFTVTNPRAKYVRFSHYNNKIEELMFVEGNAIPSQYIPCENVLANSFTLNEKQIAKVREEIAKESKSATPLFGKTIAFNGDSICKGFEDGGKQVNYGEIIAERNGMSLSNIAVAGGTIAAETYITSTNEARHWICRTIEKMPKDADYAIVEGGVNDASLAVPLGELTVGFKTPLDETTFYGAFESMLRKLVTRFAGKKYGYIAVHKMVDLFQSEDPVEVSYYHAARLCCQKWGVPFCDLNISVPPFSYFTPGAGSDVYALREAYTLNSDGWHPNREGYEKYYCDKIESWLKTL